MKPAHVLSLTPLDGGVVLSLDLRRFPPIERDKRLSEATMSVRRIAIKASAVLLTDEPDLIAFRFAETGVNRLRRICRDIEAKLPTILYAPLTPKAVDRALGISARERLLWYKGGRLPICGRGQIGRSDLRARFPLFAFWDIALIQRRPDIIEAWRRQDAETAVPT